MELPTDPQQIFDTVAKHLFAQGERSMNDDARNPMCVYRGVEGMKCAVGAIIPDELYRPEMEGLESDRVVGAFPSLLELRGNARLLKRLQFAHDHEENWKSSATMAMVLITVAAEFNLSAAIVRDLKFPWDT